MNKLKPADLIRIIEKPLAKKIHLQDVERWASSLWATTKGCGTKTCKPRFTMMLPPPNITGSLHLGHALTFAIQDTILKQKQMAGYDVTWIPGFDHAGLAAQSIVEKLLWARYKKTRKEVGKDKFLEMMDQWKVSKRDEMKNQLNRLGLSLDWQLEYFTMDEKSSSSVHEAFKRLFEKGLIYRGVRPVYWSKQLGTTLSNIEVETSGDTVRYIRTGEELELRQLPQWYISSGDLARRAVGVIQQGDIIMEPSNYINSWNDWLLGEGRQDWCISRQSYWGHRIPAYKKKSSPDELQHWVVADSVDEAAAILKCDVADLMQDLDVLDTWFSSSLLPLTISGWPQQDIFAQSRVIERFPLDIMETGFDILPFWVARMVMMSLALEDCIPFKLILLHGMICDSQGKKMSKSRGNVIDPLDIIDGAKASALAARIEDSHKQGIMNEEEYRHAIENQQRSFADGIRECGPDGLRAYLLSYDFKKEVIPIQIEQLLKISRLSNKIWNLYRFCHGAIESVGPCQLRFDGDISKVESGSLTAEDRYILSKLAKCVDVSNKSFEKEFDLHLAVAEIEYFWTECLSSKYVGHVRSILLAENTMLAKVEKVQLLINLLVIATKLWHPFMPHLTEYLYQKLNITINCFHTDGDIDHLTSLTQELYPSTRDLARFFDDNNT